MNILTFDIEEWYIYKVHNLGSSDYYLPVLKEYLAKLLELLDIKGFKATFFCLGAVARDFPDVIRLIAEHGHEIGCHSDKHLWLTKFSYEEFREDTVNAVKVLEDTTGKKIKSFRAPAFSIGEMNKWAFEILAANGIERDSSIFPASRDFGGFPTFPETKPITISYNGITLKEFPIKTIKIFGQKTAFSGGGYFRLVPYRIIKNEMQKSDYNIIYLHIRDFDKGQKRKLSIRYLKDYYGINYAYNKFCRIINDFNFVNLGMADEMIDWSSQPVVQL